MKLFTNKQLTILVMLFITFNIHAQTVVCPTETNLGPFDCNNIFDVPPLVRNLQDAMDFYGIEVTGALPETGASSVDSDLVFYCEANAREVTREVIIYNDANFNPVISDDDIIATCVFTITTIASDTEPPTFMDIEDIQLTNCEEVDFATPFAVDNCPIDPVVTFTDSIILDNQLCAELIVNRTWKAVDPCGNTTEHIQRIELIDGEGPEFTVPADITVPCGTDPMDAAITGNVFDAYDACDDAELMASSFIVEDLIQENTSCPGTTTYTKRWEAVDDCGNVTTKDQIIVVECPPDCSNQDACLGDILADPLPGECDCQVVEPQVLGCLDLRCPNFDPNVNCDDGSCLKVFDLALVKEIKSTGPFTIGDNTTVNFTITIYNEGNLAAQNIEVVDYIPVGLILADTNWTQMGANAITTIAGPLESGEAISIDVNFTINPNTTADTYTNFAEIFGAVDIFGDPVQDIDSTSDMDNGNDDYSSPLVGMADEDDHDGAEFTLIAGTPCSSDNNAGYFCE